MKLLDLLKEGKLTERVVDKPKVGDYFEWDSWLKLGQIIKIDSKQIYVKPLKGPASRGAVVSVQYAIKKIKLWGQHKGKPVWAPK